MVVTLISMDTKPEQFLELLAPLKPSLLAYIKHLLWNKNDLEDALQNVLTEAYINSANLQPELILRAGFSR